jgi:uncharacterized protein YciI
MFLPGLNHRVTMPEKKRRDVMFVISVTYLQPIEMVEPHVAAHRAFLDEQIARGVVIASGPKVPRTGGYILTSGTDREETEAIFARDPFVLNGIARYEFPALRQTGRQRNLSVCWRSS